MKRIYIALFCCIPFFVFGQNFKFKIGGGLNYSSAFLNDRINENAPSQDDLLSEEYRWYFEVGKNISSTYNQYRDAKPKVGFYVNGIGNLSFTPSLSLRLGADFQYVRMDRTISQQVVTFGNGDDYPTTLKIHDVSFTVPLSVLYTNLPLGVEYTLKNKNISFWGGVNFSARIFDKNIDPIQSRFKVRDGNNSVLVFTNPVMEEFFWTINAGISYGFREKMNIEISLQHGMSNMLDTPFQAARDISNFATSKGIILNEEKSYLKQLSIGVSYRIF